MTDTDRVRAFEDERWATAPQQPVWRHRTACELVHDQPVLDVGGGDGLLLRMLRERGLKDLSMTDLSPVGVDRAREAGFDATVADATARLPFADQSFATVCALDVLEHLRDPAPALTELARVGRQVVIAVPNFAHLKERLLMLCGRVPFQSRPQRGHSYWINMSTLMGLIEVAGLAPIEWRFEGSARLRGAGRWLAERWPDLWAVSFAVRLERR
jgi:methionine biosynthesis protein MetW